MNILAFFLSYPSLPIDAPEDVSEEAIKKGDEFRSYIWGEKGIDVSLKSLSYVDYGKDLKRILFQFYIMPCDYERIHIKEIEQYRKKVSGRYPLLCLSSRLHAGNLSRKNPPSDGPGRHRAADAGNRLPNRSEEKTHHRKRGYLQHVRQFLCSEKYKSHSGWRNCQHF